MKIFDIFAAFVLGFICLVVGATWIYRPLGFVMAGVLFIAFALIAPNIVKLKS